MMADVTDRWARVQTLFEQALDRPADERSAWLRTVCGDDPDLYRDVENLLEGDANQHTLFDGRVADLFAPADLDAALAPRPGEHVGPWVLGERIGAGGMGAVYRAERADDFEQTAAIKRVKPGMDSEAVLARFRAERQILARLEHPGIARLLGGGLDAEGRPYFAMELVAGEPITAHCDRLGLSVGDRLALFERVCEAVAYAHRQLVVHRDLKPSNVLVGTGDRGVGIGEALSRSSPQSPTPSPQSLQVKLLDFGIAKVLSDDAADAGLTQTGHRLLTPASAAPEQVRGEPPTTATDVYALGGLLYQLLCGATPLDPALSLLEVERAVLEDEPERPSARVTPEAARQRGTTPAALVKRLRGDLDTICLTALRKEPARRYGSAAELLADVRRHRADLPVEARPATTGYRVGRFVRRHRAGVLGTAAAVLALVALASFYTVRLAGERDRAETEAATAQEVSAFLASVLSGADPLGAAGDTLTAFDLLERGAARVETDLADQPEVQAAMLLTMGLVYQNLGQFDRAEELLRSALALRRELYGDAHADVAESAHQLGSLLRAQGDGEAAEPLLREALAIQRRALGPDDPATARSQRQLASLLRDRGAYDEAERLYHQALASYRQVYDEAHPDVTDVKNSLAILLEIVGRFDEAVAVMEEVVEAERSRPAPNPGLAPSLATLGSLHRELGDDDAAEAAAREALAINRIVYGDDHPDTATSLRNLASVLRDRGQYDEAGRLYDDALRIRRVALGPDHPRVANLLNSQGLLYLRSGRPEAALPIFREALRIYEAEPEPSPNRIAAATRNLASAYEALDRLDEAEALYRRSIARVRRGLGSGAVDLAFPLVALGSFLTDRGTYGEAVELLEEAVALRREALPPEHRYTAEAERSLSDALAGAGRVADARAVLTESLRRLRQSGADAELVERAQARLDDLDSPTASAR